MTLCQKVVGFVFLWTHCISAEWRKSRWRTVAGSATRMWKNVEDMFIRFDIIHECEHWRTDTASTAQAAHSFARQKFKSRSLNIVQIMSNSAISQVSLLAVSGSHLEFQCEGNVGGLHGGHWKVYPTPKNMGIAVAVLSLGGLKNQK